MLKIYTNAVTKQNYDEYGNLFSSGMPWMFYKGTEQVRWQICSETPVGADAIDPEEVWTKYTGYAGFDAVGALLTADSDYQLRMPGTLSTAVDAGTVSTVVAKISGATYALIPEAGVVTLFTPSGDSESLEYESRSLSGDVVTFTIASGSSVTNSYAVNAEMDVTQSVYMQASLDTVESDVSNGLFVFNITAFSEKLRRSIVYSNVRSLEISGLELAIFSTDSLTNEVSDIDRYVVESFTIRSGIAEIGALQDLPSGRENDVVTLVNTMLSGGFSLQFSEDNSSWHDTQTETDRYFRFRSTASGGTWSIGIELPEGAKGDAATVSVGSVTTLSAGASATVTNTGTSNAAVFNFGIPQGAAGSAGIAATVAVGTVTSGGTASVVNVGTSNAAILDFTLPVGPSGAAATISVGTVSTGNPGTSASVVNVGTSNAAILNFTIPRGSDGSGGGGGGDMYKSVYDTNNDGVVDSASAATSASSAGIATSATSAGNATNASFASTAGKFADAVSIGSASFDGSQSITVAGIGAAASSHSHAIGDVTGLRAELDETVKVVANLPTASADTVGKVILNLADSHIYKGTGSASATGDVVAHVYPDNSVDGINGGTFAYKTGSGDSRVWECEPGATAYQISYTSGEWRITGLAIDGYYHATAATGSNPWDAGLDWWFYDSTLAEDNDIHLDQTKNYVEANMTYTFTQII